ncbi:LysR family transcriptional regulator [Azorhizobium sp. AG788]|uniref:LysR family transcriptional regulator n=1 Tax=Azorhizobium sp. AG788 TaxID=2183897 RepID=UPI0031393FCD
MFVRQLHYLVAVAREGHFGRAADACHVTQPTLSAGLRKLEEELGQPLVLRGHRFMGLTDQGTRVLGWAQRIIDDYESLRQDLSGAEAGLSGILRLGAVPATLPALPDLVTAFCARHPDVRVQINSLSALAIQRGIDDQALDAGVSYLTGVRPARMRWLPFYQERYVFVTARAGAALPATMTWAEAASYPLCLLTPDMQNRQIIDEALARAGVASLPRIEANSFFGVWSQVGSGAWASIVPHTHLATFGRSADIAAVPLEGPECGQPVGLVLAERDPLAPVAAAFLRLAQRWTWPDDGATS